MELCRQKDGALSRLRAAMDDAVEDATRDVSGLCSWFPGRFPLRPNAVFFRAEAAGGVNTVAAAGASADLRLHEERTGGGGEQETSA